MLWFTALLAAVSGLLALPLEIRFFAALDDPGGPLHRRADVRWAFGLVDFTLGGPGTPARDARRRRGKGRPRRPSRFDVRRLLFNAEFWARLLSLIQRLLGAAHWRLLRLQARIGLGDPADTGRFYGLLSPVVAPVTARHPQVNIDPVFDGPALSFQFEGSACLIPLQIVWVLLSFAATPSTWRAVAPAWRT
jgi:hypothetical protein